MLKQLFTIITIVLVSNHLFAEDGFVENRGQWKGAFLFKTDIPHGALFLETNAMTFHLMDGSVLKQIHHKELPPSTSVPHHAFKIHFEGAQAFPQVKQKGFQSHYYNYYLGADESTWVSKLHPSKTVIYEELYAGIDLWVMKRGNRLKYEFHAEAGADLDQIQLRFEGVNDLSVDRDGDLKLGLSFLDMIEGKPYVYQIHRGDSVQLEAGFVVDEDKVRYAIKDHDPSLPIVIDPEIVFSTYTGAGVDNWGFSATPDKDGNLYAGGIVFGNNYPTTTGAYDLSFNDGNFDISITKFNSTGTGLLFSTFLGGEEDETPHSMVVNDVGNLYVFGATGSDDFPATNTAFDNQFSGGNSTTVIFNYPEGTDIFVTGFNSAGTNLIGSTYFGGSGNDGLNLATDLAYNYSDEYRGEIDLDDDGNVFVVSSTNSNNLSTAGSFQQNRGGMQDGVIAKFSPALEELLWSSYFGGISNDAIYSVDVAESGDVYIAGGTRSGTLPNTTGALYPTLRGDVDGFVARLSSDGNTLNRSTYFGTSSYDQVYFVQVDRDGRPTVFGQTENEFPGFIFNVSFSDVGGGQMLAALTSDLSDRVWTTQFGSTPGRPNISPTAFLVDVCNSIYLSGWGGSLNGNSNVSDVRDLPVTQDAFQSQPDFFGNDFYLAVLRPDATGLEFGTFYGGTSSDDHVDGGTSRFDRGGKIYHSVCASCGGFDDFPIEPDPGAWSTTNGSINCNNAVFKIDFQLPIIVADFNIPSFACAPFTATVQNNSVVQSNTSFFWDFGNGQTSTAINPSITYNSSGTYDVTLIVSDPQSCNFSDTLIRTITIAQDTNYVLPALERCNNEEAVLGPDPSLYTDLSNASISWQPSELVSNAGILNPTASVNRTTTFLMVIDYGGCQERVLQDIVIDRYPIETYGDTIVCSSFTPFEVSGTAFGAADSFAWSLDPSFESVIDEDSVLLIDDLSDPITRFYFRTINSEGCPMFDTLSVTQSDLDLYLTTDSTVCRNDLFRVEALSENPLNTFTYIWTLGGYSNDTADAIASTELNFIEVNLDTATTFFLTAISNRVDGCTARDSVSLTVAALDRALVEATADVDTFYRGQLIQLSGRPTNGNISFSWSPTDYMDNPRSATPQVRPKEATDYIWTVTDNENDQCSFSDTVSVRPYEILCDTPEIYLPTAFTPNGDGVNDLLLVEGRNIESMLLLIHDRWGNEVFRSEDQSTGWDGTYKGEQAEMGIYVYQLEVTCPTQEVYTAKGNISKLD